MNVASAAELLEHGELHDVRFISFAGEALDENRSDFDDDDVHQNLKVLAAGFGQILEVRLEIEIETRGATYSALAATQFHHDVEEELPDDVVKEFAERVGAMAIYPFLREIISSMSVRLRQDPLTIPLLRNGQFGPSESVEDTH